MEEYRRRKRRPAAAKPKQAGAAAPKQAQPHAPIFDVKSAPIEQDSFFFNYAGTGGSTPQPRKEEKKPKRPTAARRRKYAQGSPAAIHRQKRMHRKMIVLALFLLFVGAAVLFSTNILFRVDHIRLENADRSVPADTGIYSEEEIIEAAEIPTGGALFAVNTGKIADNLKQKFPYLEEITVHFSLPTTVAIRVTPAVERLYVKVDGGYAILSDTQRVLKIQEEAPTNLTELLAKVEGTPQVGYGLEVSQVENEEEDGSEGETVSESEKNQSLVQILDEVIEYLREEGLYDSITCINMRDTNNIQLTYDDRIKVELGTPNNMEYKCQMLGIILRNEDGNQLDKNDRGTLDVSRAPSTGKAYFTPS